MKIVKSVQFLYDLKYPYYDILSNKVNELIFINKNSRWHYESRIKSLESFATKIETGRFDKEQVFEDFFACTIVVKNLSEIDIAQKLIEKFFDIKYKRPKSPKLTHKESFSFPFDDLRLYVSLKNSETGDLSSDVLSIVFEIQIKTFLQHAWTIATHDLIYKSDEIHWGKERIAYQVKAILENAEITISGVEELSKLSEISKENKDVQRINKIINFILKHWELDDLPSDKRRFAQNIDNLLGAIKIDLSELDQILEIETGQKRGTQIRDLSPYLIVIQSIINQRKDIIERFINGDPAKFKLLITSDMSLGNLIIERRDNIIELIPPQINLPSQVSTT